jgi:hypothetical protein
MERKNLAFALPALAACVGIAATACSNDDNTGGGALFANQCVDRITLWNRVMFLPDTGAFPNECPTPSQLGSAHSYELGLHCDVFYQGPDPPDADAGDVCCYKTKCMLE